MTRRLPAHALLIVGALLAMPVSAAIAYVGQNPYAVQLRASATSVSCTDQVVISATVRSAETGDTVSNQVVIWDLKVSPSAADRLSARSTVTNDVGKTRITLSFGPAEGWRTVRATIASWPATVNVSCAGGVPTPAPTPPPTATPTTQPTAEPTAPSATPTPPRQPVNPPTPLPTATGAVPTNSPTASPTVSATDAPTVAPPTALPAEPTGAPTGTPASTDVAPATPAATPGNQGAGAEGTLTAGLLPIAFIALVVAGLGAMVLLARRR